MGPSDFDPHAAAVGAFASLPAEVLEHLHDDLQEYAHTSEAYTGKVTRWLPARMTSSMDTASWNAGSSRSMGAAARSEMSVLLICLQCCHLDGK